MTSKAWPLAVARSTAEDDFDALFMAHYDGVYRLLYRITGTREEAEDLAQETFLRLSRQRFGPGREHNVRAWLYRVATNLAFNALRGGGRRQRREAQTVYGAAAGSPALDPADVAAQADERAAVRRALSRLPERQAQLLLLRHAGLSYRELAAALAVAPGSVGTLLARAEAAFEKAWGAS